MITWKDGTKSTIYAADFPELFAKMGHDHVFAVDALTLDLKKMKQGKERRPHINGAAYETR